jgi:hypothetical protein
MPWRQLGVLALIALLLAAALAVFVGSQQRRLPPPFGPAANGSLLYAMDGDIFAADPRTGASKAIVTGPEQDVEPVYSLDGTRVLFGRTSSTEPQRLLFVANADGSGIVQVTPEPLPGVNSWSFSPGGRSIVVFATGDQGPAIVVVPIDGKTAAKTFPVFASSGVGDDGPPQYRADGSEIMFLGKDPAQASRGVYALVLATGEVRTIVAPMSSADIHGASWSPDGKYVAYGVVNRVDVAGSRTHVVRADGTGDVVVDTDPVHVADFGFDWSNDSTRLIITRWHTADGSKARSAIVPIDRSSAGVEIACPPGANSDDCTAEWTFSPDDSTLQGSIGRPDGTTAQFLADPRTGQVRSAPWTGNGHPIWQRLAP